MPELPEVEAARRALQAHCVGRRIARCAVADDAKVVVAGAGRAAFERAMVGKTIVAARRKGKNLWLQLDAPPFPSFQFGQYICVQYSLGLPTLCYYLLRSVVNSEEEWPSKYSKFFAELDDGLEFSFTDKRRFARVRLFDDPETVPPISELGPDALFEPMSVDNFLDSLGRKKIGIKALLLDQSFISGIGNWIADEVLYQSRIHPLQSASNLSRESREALHGSIQEVVKYAVEVDADLERFPKEWLFHHRWGKKPGTVNGKKIEFITAGGRTTAYVPQLQKLTGTQSSKMIASNMEQLAENGDAKDSEIDGEDTDILKPKKRAATSRAARGQQNKDITGASSRKARGNGGGDSKKPGTDAEAVEPKTAVTKSNGKQGLEQPSSNAVNKSDQATRRSSRKVKPRNK
ncbi:Formamidopyrimidine-DNA glycosylase [Dichanthelium oligosanthes]|uniref:Formamidopyrimidine-DNA glycosylase n=1 Tax=Dichanthelium oligosanthes TaxID=888268 RepID=A0A1E5VGS6_9POAL|nr:Formamidopyrimidine-DNA glycosylase [Dichanthelium oligosanthes]